MPNYSFSCTQCGEFTQHHPLSNIPAAVDCPGCSILAQRQMTAPYLGRSHRSALRLHDATRATAEQPSVIARLPARKQLHPVTTNPLHHQLPRY